MPISCPGGKSARYRWKKGGKVRLAFCGSQVVEAKSKATGRIHTPKEFARDRARRAGR